MISGLSARSAQTSTNQSTVNSRSSRIRSQNDIRLRVVRSFFAEGWCTSGAVAVSVELSVIASPGP